MKKRVDKIEKRVKNSLLTSINIEEIYWDYWCPVWVLRIHNGATNNKQERGGKNMEILLYKPPQVAEILNLGRSKTYELITTGQIKSIRVGRAIRIPAAALREYVAAQEQQQHEPRG